MLESMGDCDSSYVHQFSQDREPWLDNLASEPYVLGENWGPVVVTARGTGGSLRHELRDCRSSEMACFWKPENIQRMETGGKQASLSCRSPWSLPTAPALSWHHSTLHMAAALGRPEAASSAPLGGAKLSSNYRQPAPGQP